MMKKQVEMFAVEEIAPLWTATPLPVANAVVLRSHNATRLVIQAMRRGNAIAPAAKAPAVQQ